MIGQHQRPGGNMPVMRMDQRQIQSVDFQKSELFKQLNEAYQVNPASSKNEIFFTKKNKLFPMVSDIKRIMLAFECRVQDEITFALNSLLLYSANSFQSFIIETHHGLLDGMVGYLSDIIKNVPSLNKVLQLKEINPKPGFNAYEVHHRGSEYCFSRPPQTKEGFRSGLSVLDNYNYPISEIILFNAAKKKDVSPLFALKQRLQILSQGSTKEFAGEVLLLEQIRMIFLILRNLSFTKQNELFMGRNERLVQLMIQLFVLNADMQVNKHILEILASLSRHIQLIYVPDYKLFCERLFEVLNSDISEELEACVDIIRNLMAIQENESIIENYLPKYIDQVARLMLQTQGDIREGILEFLCFLSDLRMTTRVLLARYPKLIMRLVGLLNSGAMKAQRPQPQLLPLQNARDANGQIISVQQPNLQPIKSAADVNSDRNAEKITKLAALTLSNISLAPASRAHLKPFEKDLFVVASTDESVMKYLTNILSELISYEPETDTERALMLSTTTI